MIPLSEFYSRWDFLCLDCLSFFSLGTTTVTRRRPRSKWTWLDEDSKIRVVGYLRKIKNQSNLIQETIKVGFHTITYELYPWVYPGSYVRSLLFSKVKALVFTPCHTLLGISYPDHKKVGRTKTGTNLVLTQTFLTTSPPVSILLFSSHFQPRTTTPLVSGTDLI